MSRSASIRWTLTMMILVLLFALCSEARAGGTQHPPAHNGGNSSTSSSAARSKSSAASAATSSSASKVQNSGNSRSTATGGAATGGQADASASVGNVSPIQESEVIVHGDTTNFEAPRMPVATAIAGGTNTTADCRYSVGAGAQATIAGISFGAGRKDKDCQRQQLAEFFYSRGNADAGDVLMCRIKELREAFGPECLEWLRRSRVMQPAGPTPHQLEERKRFERGDHLK